MRCSLDWWYLTVIYINLAIRYGILYICIHTYIDTYIHTQNNRMHRNIISNPRQSLSECGWTEPGTRERFVLTIWFGKEYIACAGEFLPLERESVTTWLPTLWQKGKIWGTYFSHIHNIPKTDRQLSMYQPIPRPYLMKHYPAGPRIIYIPPKCVHACAVPNRYIGMPYTLPPRSLLPRALQAYRYDN